MFLCPSCGTENLHGVEECIACKCDLSNISTTFTPSEVIQERILYETADNLFPYKALLVQSKDPIIKAIQLMQENRYGCVMVMNNDQLVGILTERDVLYRIAYNNKDLEQTKIEEVMTPHPQFVKKEDIFVKVLNLMASHGYRHIPIVKENGIPISFISIKGVFNYLSNYALHTSEIK